MAGYYFICMHKKMTPEEDLKYQRTGMPPWDCGYTGPEYETMEEAEDQAYSHINDNLGHGGFVFNPNLNYTGARDMPGDGYPPPNQPMR